MEPCQAIIVLLLLASHCNLVIAPPRRIRPWRGAPPPLYPSHPMRADAPLPQKPSGSAAAVPTLLSILFINLMGFGIVVPLLPFYAKSFQASAWQIALVFSAYAIGAFFGEPFWGRLSDRVGRRPILISTVCGNCLCYFALAFAPTVFVAFVVRFLGGLASGNGSVVQAYVADVTTPSTRA